MLNSDVLQSDAINVTFYIATLKGAINFYRERGIVYLWGDQNFFGWSKVGPVLFHWVKGGQNFLRVQEGDQNYFSRGQTGGQNFFIHEKGGTRKN